MKLKRRKIAIKAEQHAEAKNDHNLGKVGMIVTAKIVEHFRMNRMIDKPKKQTKMYCNSAGNLENSV